MQVLIAKQNEDFFRELLPKVVFTPSTEHTSTFNITPKAFLKLRDKLRAKKLNPYALMSW